MYSIRYYPNYFKKIVTQSMMLSLLTGISLLATIGPVFSGGHLSLGIPYAVNAEEISDQDVSKYAQAILAMEQSRQQSYSEIKRIIGEAPPEIVCDQPTTYDSLPENAQKIALNYCKSSEQIVQESGLSISQFNKITRMVRSDENLQKRVQNVMSEIKQ